MKRDPSKILTEVVEKLSMVTSMERLTATVAQAARELSGADGATFVLSENDKCYYVDENAISPLWKGKRFPLEACISGWSMIHKQVVVIPDIYVDARIPHEAYRPTFVKSLCMVPIRIEKPIGAIGNYWSGSHTPTEEEIKHLQILANSTAIALENLELKQNILHSSLQNSMLANREQEFEQAIHTLAHDLRNPLATMILFTELLQRKLKDSSDERVLGYLNSILDTGYRASDQIRRMLALYTATHRSLEPKAVNLSVLATEISEHLRVGAPNRRVNFTITPNLTAIADPVLIQLALDNLISNAFKFTSKRSEASIEFGKADETSKTTTFLVRDNGEGFDDLQGSKLFRPLVRLHDVSDFPGTGLGLASVARIMELHGGTVRAEGRKSEGATFYFELPRVS